MLIMPTASIDKLGAPSWPVGPAFWCTRLLAGEVERVLFRRRHDSRRIDWCAEEGPFERRLVTGCGSTGRWLQNSEQGEHGSLLLFEDALEQATLDLGEVGGATLAGARMIDGDVERDAALVEHDDPIGQRNGLADVVGDE